MRVLVSFNQLGQMQVEVNRAGDARHGPVIATHMAPDGLQGSDVVVVDSPLVGAHPWDLLGLVRRV
jgi:hypothetical protein